MPPWRTMNTSEKLTAADLWSDRENRYLELDVVIDQAKRIEVQDIGGDRNAAKKTRCHLLFKPHPNLPAKWWAMPSAVGEVIEAITGTEEVRDWPGAPLTIYADRVRVGRKMMWGIRARRTQQREQTPSGKGPSPDEQREIAEQERRSGRG